MKNIIAIAILLPFLSACGITTQDRALSGAGIGAGIGAVGGAIAGGDPVTGAAIGAATGAAVGAVIKDSQIDLGKPIWK